MPGDKRATGARAQQAAENADDGRLPGAVRTQKTHDLAAPDAKAYVIDRDETAESLDEILGDDLARRLLDRLPFTVSSSSLSSSATNTSSMLGAATAMSANGNVARCKASAQLGNPQGCIVDNRMNAAADQNDIAYPGKAADGGAHRSAGSGRNGNDRAGHALFERGRRVAIERAAAMQECQAVAALRLVEIGGGD